MHGAAGDGAAASRPLLHAGSSLGAAAAAVDGKAVSV